MTPPDWLVPPRRRLLTPNRYHAGYKPHNVKPIEAVVLHFTVGGSAELSARYMANRTTDNNGKVLRAGASAHFVVGRDGDVWQLLPLSDRAWHAGSSTTPSRWRGLQPNPRSIGIELANLGPLFQRGDRWVDYYGRRYDGPLHANPIPLAPKGADDLASELLHQWCAHVGVGTPDAGTDDHPFEGVAWEPYAGPQLDTLRWLLETLADFYPVLREDDAEPGQAHRICAHSDCDPWRKLDTGPALDIAQLRAAL